MKHYADILWNHSMKCLQHTARLNKELQKMKENVKVWLG